MLNPQPEMSLQEVLDSYKHIELTEDEYRLAIIEAKRKKESLLKEIARQKRAEENRKQFTGTIWDYKQTRAYMLHRALTLFDGKFMLDEHNMVVFDLLCCYFSNDKNFISIASDLKVSDPSLEKGILLAGNFGTGKTWMMSLFRKNNRQVYHTEHAKELAILYKKGGEEAIERFKNKHKNPVNDPSVFYQAYAGLCIEDIGSEDVKGNFGDYSLVVGDIIEARYVNGCMRGWFHGTTNLTSENLKNKYSPRVTSRLRESVNFIELGGPDRRK